MKIEVIKATVTSLVIPNCAATCGLAGAIMLDATGVSNANTATMRVAAHFFFRFQLGEIVKNQANTRCER
jgi:hypothetical protein